MKCKVNWMDKDKMSFSAETNTGHFILMDSALERGGNNLGPSPMELVLAGTGGCTAHDIVLILKKGRQKVTGCSVVLDAERAIEDPKVFTKIHFNFTITGYNLNPTIIERAINLSRNKYCSASIMMAKTAEISYSFEIIED
ncbi:MAG: OsmC family protein [Burkholderia sp.]|nr:OsmC family protein [Burkholderia sp.]